MKKQVISLALISMVALLASCGKVEEKVETPVQPIAEEVTVTESGNTVVAEETKVEETATGEVVVEETEVEAETATGETK